MSQAVWSAVERYTLSALHAEDHALDRTLADCEAAGLPAISVAPAEGKLLHLFARSIRAERILEIGTLGGYSAIWLARALPASGKLLTVEISPEHAKVAAQNLKNAGVADRVEVRVGRALDLLPGVQRDMDRPFDLVFIDADKQSNTEYVGWAVRMTRPGGVIIVDNVIRAGDVADAASSDDRVQGVRRMNEALRSDPFIAPRVDATAIQTVGSKGYDGFAFIYVKQPG
jgi:predicted O-methyltransferase YrrM